MSRLEKVSTGLDRSNGRSYEAERSPEENQYRAEDEGKKASSEVARAMWRPGPSAIYPTLTWLEEKGYVDQMPSETRGEKSRRPYRITQKGKEALKDYEKFRGEWLDGVSQLREIWS